MPRNLRPLNPENLYLRQDYSDMGGCGLLVMVPTLNGEPDPSRPQLCIGWTSIQRIGRFEFAIPTSDPQEACGQLWLDSLEKALDEMETNMRRQALASATLPPGSDPKKILL